MNLSEIERRLKIKRTVLIAVFGLLVAAATACIVYEKVLLFVVCTIAVGYVGFFRQGILARISRKELAATDSILQGAIADYDATRKALSAVEAFITARARNEHKLLELFWRKFPPPSPWRQQIMALMLGHYASVVRTRAAGAPQSEVAESYLNVAQAIMLRTPLPRISELRKRLQDAVVRMQTANTIFKQYT